VNAAAAVDYDPTRSLLNTPMGRANANIDDSPYNFETGGLLGWSSTDTTRAVLLNTNLAAYRGQRSLQVSLKGVTDFSLGVIRVQPPNGVAIPSGRTATAYVQLATAGSVAARLVL
jgi:hypothetical protein